MKRPIVVLAGSKTNYKKIIEVRERFKKNYNVTYLEGVFKGICIKIDGDYLLQRIVSAYKNSKYVSEVFVVGPEWLYKDRIKDCTFINYNNHLADNVYAGSLATDGMCGVSTSDLPFLETRHIDETIERLEEELSSKNLILQAIDKESITDYTKSYDKPGYWFKRNLKTKAKRFLPGHLHYGDKNEVNPVFFDLVQLMYSNRGFDTDRQVGRICGFIYEELIKNKEFRTTNLLWSFVSKLPKYSFRQAKLEEISKIVEKAVIPKSNYKGSLGHVHIDVVEGPAFGFDIDTVEELESIDSAEYTPIEQIVNMPEEEVLRKASISKLH